VREIIVAIILLGIIPFGIISVNGFHDNIGIVHVQRLCSIPMNGTAYDCSEHWIMVYFPNSIFVQSPEERWLSGFAVIEDYNDGEKYSICNYFPQIREAEENNCSLKWLTVGKIQTDSCWDEVCYPLVWHEMKHLAQGQWHENMTSRDPLMTIGIIDA